MKKQSTAVTTAVEAPADMFKIIDRSMIVPSPTNPRKSIDETALRELADSISKVGLLEPVLVRDKFDGREYELIAGERRWRACEIAGVDAIPAIVKNVSDEQALEIQIIENLQRRDVHPLDEADGFDHLKKTLGWTEEEIGLRIGKPASYVAQRLKLTNLAEKPRRYFTSNVLTLGHVLEIAKFKEFDQENVMRLAFVSRHQDGGPTVTVKKFVEEIEREFLLRLSSAPFPTKSTDLRADGLACNKCPNRTAAQALLFGDTYEKDSCLDRTCWKEKTAAYVQIQRRAAAAEKVGTDAGEAAIGKAIAKIPLVSSRYYDEAGKGVLTRDKFEILKDKENCEFAETGIYYAEDRESPGQTVRICRDPTCKKHKGKYSSTRSSQGNAEDAESAREERLIRKEEIFDAKVAESVRHRILREITGRIDASTVTLTGLSDLSARAACRLWNLAGNDSARSLARLVLGDEIKLVDGGGGDYDSPVRHLDLFEAMPKDLLAKLLFLLLFGRDGEILQSNWTWKSQRPVRDLASVFGIDYRKYDAVERLSQCPSKLNDIYRHYLHEVEAGNKPAIPRPYSSKWKPKD